MAGVAEGYVIGVDLGGTKLLAGAVDADLNSPFTVPTGLPRFVSGRAREMVAEAMEEMRNAVGGPPPRSVSASPARSIRARVWPCRRSTCR